MDTIQLEPVPRNLVIDIIRLACNASNVLILLIGFSTHCATQLVQALGCNV